jgi:hypothetical protein
MSHYIELRYSNRGGYNYGNWQARDGGATGSFLTPLIWRRLGMAKEERIWEFRDTSNVAAEILAAQIQGQ